MQAIMDIEKNSWSRENTPSLLSKSMFYYIQSIGHFFCNENYMTDRSNYNSMLLTYTNSGEGILRYRNQTYRIGCGQVFIIDCFEHQFYGTGGSGFWEFDWIHFNGSESRNYVAQILSNSGPVFNVDKDSVIPECIKKIHKMINEKDKRTDIIASKIIVEILTELLLKSCGTGEFHDSQIPGLIQSAINKIERNYNNPINLDFLSKELCVSKFHLSRLFKKHTGFSPYEYLIKQRINQAKSLLKTTEYSVGEISRIVGFESTSHFIKVFNHHERTTPLKFRRFWR